MTSDLPGLPLVGEGGRRERGIGSSERERERERDRETERDSQTDRQTDRVLIYLQANIVQPAAAANGDQFQWLVKQFNTGVPRH